MSDAKESKDAKTNQSLDSATVYPDYVYEESSNHKASNAVTTTTAQLILKFFGHFANDFDYVADCVSVRCGKTIKKVTFLPNFNQMISKTQMLQQTETLMSQ